MESGKKARSGTAGPPAGGGADGVSDAARNRARVAGIAAFTAPFCLIVGLALAGGGYDISDRHVAGIVVWLAVIGLIVLGAGGSSVMSRPFYAIAGVLFAFAVFTGLSALWSGSAERSVIEADRVLVYLGVFVAGFLIAQTAERRQRLLEGLALGLAAVMLLSLASRLLPDIVSVSTRAQAQIGAEARLSYPFPYWNAAAAMFAFTAIGLLWLSRRGSGRWLRCAGAVLLPVSTRGAASSCVWHAIRHASASHLTMRARRQAR